MGLPSVITLFNEIMMHLKAQMVKSLQRVLRVESESNSPAGERFAADHLPNANHVQVHILYVHMYLQSPAANV